MPEWRILFFVSDVEVDVPGYGKMSMDIGYGGGFYAIVPASNFGLDVNESRARDLIAVGDIFTGKFTPAGYRQISNIRRTKS